MAQFRPHIAIEHLLLGTFRGHMKKSGPTLLKLSEILEFQWILKDFNPTSHGVSDSLAPMGGASEAPPSEIKEGVIFDPMLLCSICYLVFLGVTCKKSARNLKI